LIHQASGKFGQGLGGVGTSLNKETAVTDKGKPTFSKPQFSSLKSNVSGPNFSMSKQANLQNIYQSQDTSAGGTIDTYALNGGPSNKGLAPSSSESTLFKGRGPTRPSIGGKKLDKPAGMNKPTFQPGSV